ncbi:MAG: prepilin-type N-terminal cleavage/methylation domain-containing protein [Akkermansia sp.]|nr:prepilin-type N-terminal cleavage/methylation domain-containing protein [Akkermansia sp.]
MKISLSPRSAKGFTLIELIIVIAILATLSSIAYPTYMAIQENAGRTAAKKVCTDIVSAVESFKQDNNGMLPYDTEMVEPDSRDQMYLSTTAGEDANMIKVLTNREDDEGRRLNSTRDIYLRSDEQEQPREGLFVDASGEIHFYDPWGKPYYIVLCEEDEGCIDPFTTRRYRGKNCLVYSTGPDQEGMASVASTSSDDEDAPKGKKAKKAAAEAAAAAAELAEEALEDNVYSWKNQK